MCNHRIWDDIVPRLRANGHTVYAVNLEPMFGSIDSFPDSVEAAVQSLCAHTGQSQVALVGHSMGGNVVMLYAGVRSGRIRRLVNLEGFGMPATTPDEAPGRYVKWMDELKKLRTGEMDLKAYDSLDGVARRLMKTNPRLDQDKASWLAQHWARENTPGQWTILGEPAHKIANAQIYRADEVREIYKCISMPVLAVEASSDSLNQWFKGKYTLADYHERLKAVPQVDIARIDDAGHMVHHDQPGLLATVIERFLA